MLTLQKIHDDLDYWIMLGIGDDIVRMPAHRAEYQHLVKIAKKATGLKPDDVPLFVLHLIKAELTRNALFRLTSYRLAFLALKKKLRGV